MQTPRTKAKITENLGLLKQFLTTKYGKPVDDDTELVLFNALSWTADDVEAQYSTQLQELANLQKLYAMTKDELEMLKAKKAEQ